MIMTNLQLKDKLLNIAKYYNTLYIMGCIGAPLTKDNKAYYTKNHSYNMNPSRTAMINRASNDTFGFDCVNLIKSILWGWTGDKSQRYGGAKYASNGVPDVNANGMIQLCKDVSADFSKIEIGEAVWMSGHIGVYVGDGLAVECTPAWNNCVQITACNCDKIGYHRRNWIKHGKLPWVEYIGGQKSEIEKALEQLTEAGIIKSPEYWQINHGKIPYLDDLIINMAVYAGRQ